jgi:adenine C2-methylase RlmN of 23S rRNA A2503 and tRNA A37
MSLMPEQMDFTRLDSALDKSVNFFVSTPDGGKIETRFVQRYSDRFIVYISSMTGCDKACRFCHLTQNGETMATLLTREQMVAQADQVLKESDFQGATLVHFNFMARGEPLSNPAVDATLFKQLKVLAHERGLDCRIKVSTILPLDVITEDGRNLWDEDTPPVDLYYSLYSVDASWRKRWIPKAKAPDEALAWLRRYQQTSGNRVILHWALIDGENDDLKNAGAAFDRATAANLNFDFNLVRYNPANDKSRESSEINIENFMKIAESAVSEGQRARMVNRVGFDVAASCGMFLVGKSQTLSGETRAIA